MGQWCSWTLCYAVTVLSFVLFHSSHACCSIKDLQLSLSLLRREVLEEIPLLTYFVRCWAELSSGNHHNADVCQYFQSLWNSFLSFGITAGDMKAKKQKKSRSHIHPFHSVSTIIYMGCVPIARILAWKYALWGCWRHRTAQSTVLIHWKSKGTHDA